MLCASSVGKKGDHKASKSVNSRSHNRRSENQNQSPDCQVPAVAATLAFWILQCALSASPPPMLAAQYLLVARLPLCSLGYRFRSEEHTSELQSLMRI